MTNTPNFNFTIAEGTDTVNLLTQLYPNFTSLDTILQAIKESGTTIAVTTKVGTVHNIVRNVADCNVIRWIATANYVAGDTFTVDGNAVTATAMDGTALPGGAFVINQSVLAILNSGVLTIVGVPGVSSVAASAVTYDNTGSGLSATDVQDAIDEVAGETTNIDTKFGTYVTSTLTAGSTTLTFTDPAIKTTSFLDLYFWDAVILYSAVSVSAGQAVFTVDAQSSNVNAALRVTDL